MANSEKGEVELRAGGATYVLRYSIDAICDLEERLDKSFAIIAVELDDPVRRRLSMVREVLLAGLRERHPDMTLKQAGELIVSAGGAPIVLGKIGEAMTSAFPQVEASDKKSPRQRANGRQPTGSPS